VPQASAGLREAGARLTNASRAVDNTDWLKTAAIGAISLSIAQPPVRNARLEQHQALVDRLCKGFHRTGQC
jgi:hypothetical protein